MNESGTEFVPVQEHQKHTELTPQERYGQLLDKYTNCSQRMRELYCSKRQGENAKLDKIKIQELDFKRHNTHEELNQLGVSFGKSKEQVISDIMFNEGNLREIGIDTPVVRLPFLGTSFKLDKNKQTIISDDLNLPSQILETPEGKRIFGIHQKHDIMRGFKSYEEEYSGDKKEMKKWTEKPYYVIVFAVSRYHNGIIDTPDYPLMFETRLKRMKELARDYGLNCFHAYDVTGHIDYGPETMDGIEVSGEDLEKIGLAMKNYPEKYWLTEEELQDPYKKEFLERELSEYKYFDSYINKAADTRKPEINNWRNWYNFLKICDVYIEKNPEDRDIVERKEYFSEFINKSIMEASVENNSVANEMKEISGRIFHSN